MPATRLFPADWLDVGSYQDVPLGLLKTGKESEVHLVARTGTSKTALLAEKRFKAWDRRSFRDDSTYRGVWGQGTRRESRAMRKNTRYGHVAVHARWIAHEWDTLVRLKVFSLERYIVERKERLRGLDPNRDAAAYDALFEELLELEKTKRAIATGSLGTTVPSATPLILTAHVSGTPMPTGSVSFSDSLTALPSNRALTNGAVSINVNSLPLGTNTITASYSGDPTYAPATGSLTITVTEQPNDKFLIHLYTDMLGQQDASGEAYWASQMAKGQPRPSVAFAFTQTLNYDNAVVAQLYQSIMQRPASGDPSGANFWANQLRLGSTPERIAASMVASDERFASPSFGNNTLDTFIAATYQALLGRSDLGDPGAAYWHNFLITGGPRWQMTLDFVSGPEWAGVTVKNMYTKFHLGTPDSGSLNYWAGQVMAGMHDDQLAAQLTGSQQYYDWTQSH